MLHLLVSRLDSFPDGKQRRPRKNPCTRSCNGLDSRVDRKVDSDYSTLEGQLRLYDERFDRALASLLRDLESGAYRRHLRQLGRERLTAGFAIFGDEMYRWHPAVRQANTDEEVADALVYLTSEP